MILHIILFNCLNREKAKSGYPVFFVERLTTTPIRYRYLLILVWKLHYHYLFPYR